jgi:hypothetical protein
MKMNLLKASSSLVKECPNSLAHYSKAVYGEAEVLYE